MKIICLVSIFFVFSFVNLFSNEADTLRKFKKYHTTVYVSVGSGFIIHSKEFFEIYKNVLGGDISDFKMTPIFGIGTKVLFTPELRFGISAEFVELRINDFFTQTVKQNGSRLIGEAFDFRQIPVLITAEYVPYSPWQFKSYVGGGIGVNIASTNWTEQINSNLIADKRISGVQYNSLDILPALRIYSGIELGFDRMTYLHFLGSLIIQFSYTQYFGSIDLYNKIRKQFNEVPQEINNTILPIQGYLYLGMAISFNFNKKYK